MIDSPACVAHPPCDQCPRCRQGRCCRRDNPEYRLPELGTITPYFGALGERNDDGERVECHVCGGWFYSIGSHSWAAHDLTAAEYRTAFGLSSSGLLGPAYRKRKRALQQRLWRERRERPALVRPTREQRAAGQASLETRTKVAAARARVVPKLLAASHMPAAVAKMRRTKAERSRAFRERRACRECGRVFEVQRWQAQQTCTRECARAQRRKRGRAVALRRIAEGVVPRPPTMTDDMRRTIAAKATERWSHASDDERAAAAARLARYSESIGPDGAAEQRRRANAAAVAVTRKPHYCTAGCGRLLPRANPKTCSPECRKVVRQRTARAVIASRVAAA